MPREPKHTLAARSWVLDSHSQGGDWLLVANHNGIPPTTARRLVDRGKTNISYWAYNQIRGGCKARLIVCFGMARSRNDHTCKRWLSWK
ncbi:Hypothetical protein PHPALM_8606 [Phytophthora palmivora]|uniref:Uncharacterized protein n=1 Tax=Phytophthora palmivora TaxID=4796 RepID=A0A2P4Y9U8_9STRA|nr:Hypothetical protein PHPALM_8606 [Phytophthora palmivora]